MKRSPLHVFGFKCSLSCGDLKDHVPRTREMSVSGSAHTFTGGTKNSGGWTRAGGEGRGADQMAGRGGRREAGTFGLLAIVWFSFVKLDRPLADCLTRDAQPSELFLLSPAILPLHPHISVPNSDTMFSFEVDSRSWKVHFMHLKWNALF